MNSISISKPETGSFISKEISPDCSWTGSGNSHGSIRPFWHLRRREFSPSPSARQRSIYFPGCKLKYGPREIMPYPFSAVTALPLSKWTSSTSSGSVRSAHTLARSKGPVIKRRTASIRHPIPAYRIFLMPVPLSDALCQAAEEQALRMKWHLLLSTAVSLQTRPSPSRQLCLKT